MPFHVAKQNKDVNIFVAGCAPNLIAIPKFMKKISVVSFILFFSLHVILAGNYKRDQNISYTTSHDPYALQRCKLDLYHPADTTGLPVIVWFHGGGLTGGEKFIPEELEQSGYVVVAPNYRLIPNVEIDSCINDAAEAVAWTINNISNFGGDPDKIFVSGHSAGGYLASMIGLDKSWLKKYGKDPDNLAGLIPLSGQVITHFAQRQQKGISELTPTIGEYAPIFHIRKDAPPYVIITGDRELELYGRHEENAYMWRMMKLIGHPYVFIYELDGYDHGAMYKPAFHILKTTVKDILQQND